MYLNLDTTDIAPYLRDGGYSVFYRDVFGPNSFITLDGKTHEDLVARKAVITAVLTLVTTAELAVIVAACDDVSSVTYFDTKTNDYATVTAKATVSIGTVLITKSTIYYWGGNRGIVITLEEK